MTIRFATPEDPRQLSCELRKGRDPELARRRAIVGLAFFAGACTAVVALRQIGIVRRLPEPKIRGLDTERVVGTPDAYGVFSTPDAFFAVASYATTAALAAMGGARRSQRRPWIPLAMAAKLLLDSSVAGWLLWFQSSKLHAFCVWCLATSAATFAALPLAVPESLHAIRSLRNRRATALRSFNPPAQELSFSQAQP